MRQVGRFDTTWEHSNVIATIDHIFHGSHKFPEVDPDSQLKTKLGGQKISYLPVPRHLGTMPGIASVSTYHQHRWKKQFDEEPEQRTMDLKDLLAVHPIQKTGDPLDATKEVGHYSTRMLRVKVQEKR